MAIPIDRGLKLKQIYSALDRKFEEERTQQRAINYNLPYINLYSFPVDQSALSIVSKEQAKELGALVFFRESRNLKLGVLAPSVLVNRLIQELQNQNYFVEMYLISQGSFDHVFLGYDRMVVASRKSQEIRLTSKDKKFEITTLQEFSHRLAGISATELLELLLGTALNFDASDIHIEPTKTDLKLRYRIDGVLQDAGSLSLALHHAIISRIKVLSKLKLNLVAVPQEGSFSLTHDNLAVDVRVSVLPSAFGESLVMRLLRQDKKLLNFEELGLLGQAYEQLLTELRKPNGMILTTGPTGSGKTTTLCAILNRLNEPGVKIITLEDPVEYRIPGITQTPVNPQAGFTFATGLRAVLRQDPDVVMVGEMRDLETAEVASQAALTGHIVLSTLHTNDAAGAIPRLIDLGVKPFVLAPAINAVIAQRLVRRICTVCKTEYKLEKSLMTRVEFVLSTISKNAKVTLPKTLKFYHSTGCPVCRGLGYKGRIGVYEIFLVNEAIEKLIQKEATNSEIQRQAILDGMITMAQDGVLKALSGITDIEEVFRVTEE